MVLHLFLFLLLVCLLSASEAWASWLFLFSAFLLAGKGQAQHTPPTAEAPRPDDCPACRLASPASSNGEPAPLPVRPWREVKSRRGAPKRINTEGFACPTVSARTSATPTLPSMPSSEMASMARPSGFRRSGVRRATLPSVRDVTRPCTD